MKLDIPSITKRIEELTEGGALPSVEASPGEPCAYDESEPCDQCRVLRGDHAGAEHDFEPSIIYFCKGCGSETYYNSNTRREHPDSDHDFDAVFVKARSHIEAPLSTFTAHAETIAATRIAQAIVDSYATSERRFTAEDAKDGPAEEDWAAAFDALRLVQACHPRVLDAVFERQAKPAAGGTNPLSLELIALYEFAKATLEACKDPMPGVDEWTDGLGFAQEMVAKAATTAYERALDTTVPPSAVSTEKEA